MVGMEKPWWSDQDDIVITGSSCRFPESDNMEEFSHNLYNKIDMVTVDDRRWAPGLYGLPERCGKIKNYAQFDSAFFGIVPKNVLCMDPQVRQLMHCSYEAIVDAGYNPVSLRGKEIGVFVGHSGSETMGVMIREPETTTGYTSSSASTIFANRVSHYLDFSGPSITCDTACNSGLLAMQLALTAMRNHHCSAALVCGSSANLTPTMALQFLKLGVLAPDGTSRSYDAKGTGYARAEGVGAIFLQRSKDARRIYAKVIHGRNNSDGHKDEGIAFPSCVKRAEVMKCVYEEACVDPSEVVWLEGNGNGSPSGDIQEVKAVEKTLLPGRKEPLLIGSVKSNMGHAEPASGSASLAKVVLACNNGVIPPNLHFTEPNPNIPALLDGRVKVVTEPTPWKGGYVGINSFGYGGSNTHILLKADEFEKEAVVEKVEMPRLFCYTGRMEEGVEVGLREAEKHRDNPHFLQLLSELSTTVDNLLSYRGYLLMNRNNGADSIHNIQKYGASGRRPVWFVYSGMGSQWAGMGRDLMELKEFRESVLASSEVLRPLGEDPYSLLMKYDENVFKSVKNALICNVVIQLALTDVLKTMGVEPDAFVGHSTGEIGCGYADGGLDRRQAVLLAFYRAQVILDIGLPPGAMAAVGLTWEQAKERCSEGVIAACHNGKDSVTISGDADKVLELVKQLEAEKVFAKMVDSSGVAFHSAHMKPGEESLLRHFKEFIPKPKPKSEKWVSSSISKEREEEDIAKWCSAEYHVNNIMSPVLFYEALQNVPENAIIIEVASHALLQAVLRRSLPSTCTNVGLMKRKHENSLEFLLEAMGKIYQAGVAVDFQSLYPKVEYPVPRGTPMIGNLMRWNYSQPYTVVHHKDYDNNRLVKTVTIDPSNSESVQDTFYLDHKIDGRSVFPFSGYLFLAWKVLCQCRDVDFEKTGVIFKELTVYRDTLITEKPMNFKVILSTGRGLFEIVEAGDLVASGEIRLVGAEEVPPFYPEVSSTLIERNSKEMRLTSDDVYRTFRLNGYEYQDTFQLIDDFNLEGTEGYVKWQGNWVPFLDNLLQACILSLGSKSVGLQLPVGLNYLRIDPVATLESLIETGEGEEKKSVVPVRLQKQTGGLMAGGVELRDLTCQVATRRIHHRNLRLLVSEFVKSEDAHCLDQHQTQRDNMQTYAGSCEKMFQQMINKLKETDRLKLLPNSGILTEALTAFKYDKTIPNGWCLEGVTVDEEEEVRNSMGKPKHTLLKVLHQLHETISESSTDETFAENARHIVKKSLDDIARDALWSSATVSRCSTPLVDMCIQNSSVTVKQCAAIEPYALYQTQMVDSLLSVNHRTQASWVLVSPTLKAAEDSALRKVQVDIGAGQEFPKETSHPFQIILLDRVLSRKRDPVAYLSELKKVMSDYGFAVVTETTNNYPLTLFIESLGGIVGESSLGGSRLYGKYFTHEQVLKIFEDAGLQLCGFQTDPAVWGTCYLIRKPAKRELKPTVLDVSDIQEFSWVEPLKKKVEGLQNEPVENTIWLKDLDHRDSGIEGLTNCFRQEITNANRFRSLADLSLQDGNKHKPLTMESPEVKKRMARNLSSNLYRDGVWGSFQQIELNDDDTFVETEHAFITNLVPGDLSSFAWVESANKYYEFLPGRTTENMLMYSYYFPLNSRDVMLATGRITEDAVPKPRWENTIRRIPGYEPLRDSLLGLEYSGKLSDGRRVIGILPGNTMSTTVAIDTAMWCWDCPENLTLEEAATIPLVYVIAYYALEIIGSMTKGERVLIHDGCGAMGQAAISIALHAGCEVFTTVSTEEGKRFLQERFPELKDRHFSDSHSTKFERDILERTNGHGVHLILNSLPTDKLEASMSCLDFFGRLLQIGRVDMPRNAKLGMAILLKNASLHGVVVDDLLTPAFRQRVSDLMTDGLAKGVVKPIQSTLFNSDQMEDAFRYMEQGENRGKVLIKLRDEVDGPPPPLKVKALSKFYARPDHVYCITGGTDGIGLELSDWLVSRGAKKVVLVSISCVKTTYKQRYLKRWREESGATVDEVVLDVSEREQAYQLIRECLKLGPLAGLFHSDLGFTDAMFENQKVEKFKLFGKAKYWRTKHLDKATRELCGQELKHFVGFSSICSSPRSPGQTANSWFNSSMERIIEKRVADGLCGMAIQWGALGDVDDISDNNCREDIAGTRPERIHSVLHTLDVFLGRKQGIVSSLSTAEKKRTLGSGGDIVQPITTDVADSHSPDQDRALMTTEKLDTETVEGDHTGIIKGTKLALSTGGIIIKDLKGPEQQQRDPNTRG